MRTVNITIQGIVQGVGFRPFVYQQAHEFHIGGFVCNTPTGVEITAQGTSKHVEQFLENLRTNPPPQASIETLAVEEKKDVKHYDEFIITQSRVDGHRTARISPDLAVCQDCLKELFAPDNRRYLYPFINCTNCGPRFTIVRDIPYDRAKTTMSAFAMCPDCQHEYDNPMDRRFHAQPNACHACGPRIQLRDKNGEIVSTGIDAAGVEHLIMQTVKLLEQGSIVAIKGLGGYHIACRADREEPVALLRRRKNREEKPFAIMVKDVSQARKIASVSSSEASRLQAVDAPIILLAKKEDHGLAEDTAPGTVTYGIMLPSTPLQHILFKYIDFPLIMTSGNIADEPIAFTDEQALKSLYGICDFFITGQREIHTRTDDSVMQLFRESDYLIRRARGFVPQPVSIIHHIEKPVLALGAELKNTICLAQGNSIWLSSHIGDLSNREAYRSFLRSIEHVLKLQSVIPEIIAHDLHPRYLSSQFAVDPPPQYDWMFRTIKFPVQHHHAHIVSAMAENKISGPVIGVAFDGTGLGTDGNVWGGEILIADEKSFERKACLSEVVMPGGDLAVAEPWRMALSYLKAACGDAWPEYLPTAWAEIEKTKIMVTMHQIEQSMTLPLTSSCGRLFDAVSALCGICLEASYEGQPAAMLEAQSGECRAEKGYQFHIVEQDDILRIDWREAVRQVVFDIKKKKHASEIGAKFHAGLVKAVLDAVIQLSRTHGIKKVALSGGCFINRKLLAGTVAGMEKNGLQPVIHSHVPCNDGGIALGQAVIAAAHLQA